MLAKKEQAGASFWIEGMHLFSKVQKLRCSPAASSSPIWVLGLCCGTFGATWLVSRPFDCTCSVVLALGSVKTPNGDPEDNHLALTSVSLADLQLLSGPQFPPLWYDILLVFKGFLITDVLSLDFPKCALWNPEPLRCSMEKGSILTHVWAWSQTQPICWGMPVGSRSKSRLLPPSTLPKLKLSWFKSQVGTDVAFPAPPRAPIVLKTKSHSLACKTLGMGTQSQLYLWIRNWQSHRRLLRRTSSRI